MERRSLSYSQVSTYRKCHQLWYKVYVENLRIPPAWVLPFGRSVEGGLNHNYYQKIRTYKDVPKKQVVEAYAESFKEAFESEEVDWQGENKNKVFNTGRGLVEVHHTERAPLIQPSAVQQKIVTRFSNVPYTFVAKLDIIEEAKRIVDLKTSKKTPTQDMVISSDQLTAYSLSFRQEYGRDEELVRLEYMVSTKEPKCVPLQATRTWEEIEAYLKVVGQVYQGIQDENWTPCDEQFNWTCSLTSCGFYRMCKPKRMVILMEKDLLRQQAIKIAKEKEREEKAKAKEEAKIKKAKEKEANAKKKKEGKDGSTTEG